MDSAPTTEFRVCLNRLGTLKHHPETIDILIFIEVKIRYHFLCTAINYSFTSRISKYILFKKAPKTQQYLFLLLNCIDWVTAVSV